MPRRKQTRKIKIIPKGSKIYRKDLRFSLSLVVLIGALSFSMILLLLSLNKQACVSAQAMTSLDSWPTKKLSNLRESKGKSQVLDDNLLDFKITIPNQLGNWFYKIGEVKSLTDESLSNQYLRIYVSFPGKRSNNFDKQNMPILTIRKFSSKEWKSIEKDCPDGDICKAAGEVIAKTDNSSSKEWVYAFVKATDCPKNIETKCALADKIVESFQLK